MAAKKIQRKAKPVKRKKKLSVAVKTKKVVIAEPATTPQPVSAPAPAPAESDTAIYLRREAERQDGDSAIKLYLREIGQVKLLTPQEEIELAAKIKKGDKKAREHMIKA
ncbi:MAG TPA: sigma-70 factor domain-containing protein, partial [bacterium]|nr:sigma-70 factor domain-containing protein [bacterium]